MCGSEGSFESPLDLPCVVELGGDSLCGSPGAVVPELAPEIALVLRVTLDALLLGFSKKDIDLCGTSGSTDGSLADEGVPRNLESRWVRGEILPEVEWVCLSLSRTGGMSTDVEKEFEEFRLVLRAENCLRPDRGH